MKYGFFRQFFGYSRFLLRADLQENCGQNAKNQSVDYFFGLILASLETDIFDISKDGADICFCCMDRSKEKLCALCEKHGILLEEKARVGLKSFVLNHKSRIGILIGLVLCLALHIVSEKTVWEIRVLGNQRVSEKEVVKLLENCGFGEGTYYPGVDLESLYREVLLADSRISWISVNIKGTVALAEIRESLELPPKTDYKKPANLVAARDGRIVRIDILYGGKEVANGDYVNAGQLLASPFFPSRVSGPVFQSPIGSVYAETQRSFEVILPKKIYQKQYSGKNVADYSFKILGKSINVNRIAPPKYDKYDINHSSGNVEIFGGIVLPVKFLKREFCHYETLEIVRNSDELYSMGKDEIYSLISHELEDAEILELEFDCIESDFDVTVKCNAKVIENIAVSVPIEFEP